MAVTGTLVRWFESHQIAPDIGHIPVSNLYEVFVLFCWLTTVFHLYYEERFATRSLGAYVMLVVSGAVSFLLPLYPIALAATTKVFNVWQADNFTLEHIRHVVETPLLRKVDIAALVRLAALESLASAPCPEA